MTGELERVPSGRRVAESVGVRMRVQVEPEGGVPWVDVDLDGGRTTSLAPEVARQLLLDVAATLTVIERFEATQAQRAADAAARAAASTPGGPA